jgi:hypothetical protein
MTNKNRERLKNIPEELKFWVHHYAYVIVEFQNKKGILLTILKFIK